MVQLITPQKWGEWGGEGYNDFDKCLKNGCIGWEKRPIRPLIGF
jgi:hypothetical protein